MVTKALIIAISAHQGQVDKGGVPYITHPIRMALTFSDPKLQTIALLHDVVEDTPVTLRDLSHDFPDDVVDAIDAMTHRPGEDYDAYLLRVKENLLATQVKIADLRDNLSPTRDYPNRDTTKYQAALKSLTML